MKGYLWFAKTLLERLGNTGAAGDAWVGWSGYGLGANVNKLLSHVRTDRHAGRPPLGQLAEGGGGEEEEVVVVVVKVMVLEDQLEKVGGR